MCFEILSGLVWFSNLNKNESSHLNCTYMYILRVYIVYVYMHVCAVVNIVNALYSEGEGAKPRYRRSQTQRTAGPNPSPLPPPPSIYVEIYALSVVTSRPSKVFKICMFR
jgi:hypothetical protein